MDTPETLTCSCCRPAQAGAGAPQSAWAGAWAVAVAGARAGPGAAAGARAGTGGRAGAWAVAGAGAAAGAGAGTGAGAGAGACAGAGAAPGDGAGTRPARAAACMHKALKTFFWEAQTILLPAWYTLACKMCCTGEQAGVLFQQVQAQWESPHLPATTLCALKIPHHAHTKAQAWLACMALTTLFLVLGLVLMW